MSTLRWVPTGLFTDQVGLANQVRNLLLEAVTAGHLRPGDRINEAELARRLGISRNPIREAVSGLAQKGFLVAIPRRGHFLRSFTRQDLDDIFSFRICVETFAIRQAMERMGQGGIDLIQSIYDRMVVAAEAVDLTRLHQADIDFHRAVCELSGNRQTARAHQGLETELRMLIAYVDLEQESPMQSALVHRPIVEAVAAGDTARAVSAMEVHIRSTWSNILAIYDEGQTKPAKKGR